MKEKIIPLFIIIALIAGASAFLISHKPVEIVVGNPAATTTETVSTSTTVEIKTLELASTTFRVTVQYPQFSNMPALNDRIKKEAEELFATSSKESDENAKELIKLGVDLKDRDLTIERKVDPKKTYINDQTRVASITYRHYIDLGGAHGSFFFGSAAYDLGSGEDLTLGSFLSGHENPIREYVKAQIAAASSSSATCVNCEYLSGRIDQGADPLSKNFALSADGLTMLYGAYELGAYASTAGGQEVLIPKNMLRELGVVSRVW